MMPRGRVVRAVPLAIAIVLVMVALSRAAARAVRQPALSRAAGRARPEHGRSAWPRPRRADVAERARSPRAALTGRSRSSTTAARQVATRRRSRCSAAPTAEEQQERRAGRPDRRRQPAGRAHARRPVASCTERIAAIFTTETSLRAAARRRR